MLMKGSYPQYLKTRILSDKGHLSNVSAASSAADLAKAGVQGIVLGHISRDNNREEKAFSEAAGALARIGATPRDIFLGLAYRDSYGSFYRIR
ncbi:MAG: MBL fold metallo-hydrolase, partial [Bacillota bacterium]|nr:MBL fold metallo-hydrolase [Bacillota bacterium]